MMRCLRLPSDDAKREVAKLRKPSKWWCVVWDCLLMQLDWSKLEQRSAFGFSQKFRSRAFSYNGPLPFSWDWRGHGGGNDDVHLTALSWMLEMAYMTTEPAITEVWQSEIRANVFGIPGVARICQPAGRSCPSAVNAAHTLHVSHSMGLVAPSSTSFKFLIQTWRVWRSCKFCVRAYARIWSKQEKAMFSVRPRQGRVSLTSNERVLKRLQRTANDWQEIIGVRTGTQAVDGRLTSGIRRNANLRSIYA
jgi:hypothetical protein